jgi:hypothetical protein
MTEKEYEDLQDKLQAISYLHYANTERKKRKDQERKIADDIEAYKREASRFKMISTEIMSKFAESRLGLSKIQAVINVYNSLMKRIILPGDFPDSASNYAQYPEIITFAKDVTAEGDTELKYIFLDPEEATKPGPGNIAKTIYTAEWIASKAQSASIENPIPDPLNIYETGDMWKHISNELQEKHVGRLYPNVCRPIYLNVPITEPDWVDQTGETHTRAFDIDPIQHDDPWPTYVKDYNRIRKKALETQVVDKKQDAINAKKKNYDKNAPKPMKSLICSYEDAEEMLNITLENAVESRLLSTSLPRRGSDKTISDALKSCLIEYATKTKMLYIDLFFHITACEMIIFCATHQAPVWSSETLMSQDPHQQVAEPDYSSFIPRGRNAPFNHNLELQQIAYQLTHLSREQLRYQLLIVSLTIYVSAITTAQNTLDAPSMSTF